MQQAETTQIDNTAENKSSYIVRFNTRQRIEHILLMIIFVVLAITGLIQRYHSVGVSEWIILRLGGIEMTRMIHRGIGFLFTAGVLYHFAFSLIDVFGRHKKASMMPTLNDFKGIVAELKHNMGMMKEKPQFGRFDYRQKFEYFGMMFGSVILIVTGFMLLFPVLITTFLPGQAIAVALQFHGWEATLAVLVIVVWHIYDSVLRPDIFPTDKTIFTGKISLEREKEEHGLEYQETVKKG